MWPQLLRAFVAVLALLTLPLAVSGEQAPFDFGSYLQKYDAAFALLNLQDGSMIRHNPSACATRFAPCSTFKIPNTIVGLEAGVIPGPEFSLKWDGTRYPIEEWNRDQTLRSAFRDSCVWFYQEIARRNGPERFTEALNRWEYGNRDISGGITQFWLSSTLAISPDEQCRFLQRLYSDQLGISKRTKDLVLDLMVYRSEDGFVLRGKTGTAGSAERNIATEGWYVGFLECKRGNYAFALHLTGGENPSGRNARGIVERMFRDFAAAGNSRQD